MTICCETMPCAYLKAMGDQRAEIERLTAEVERLRNVAADLLNLVAEMPVKHPQQDTRRRVLHAQCEQFGVVQQYPAPPDRVTVRGRVTGWRKMNGDPVFASRQR